MRELQHVLRGLLPVLLVWGPGLTQHVPHLPSAQGQQTEVEALEGDRAVLPCDMTVPTLGEKVAHVNFWHAGQHSGIIYRADVWGKPFAKASHWAPNSYSTRAILEEQGLVLDDVTHEDEGEYRCQVEFYEAPSRVLRITLTVVDPTISMAIEGGGVVMVGRAGVPRDVVIKVHGSKPPFMVTCLLDGVMYTAKQREINKFTFMWTPAASQHGANLFCDAHRTALPGTASVSAKLSVLYRPLVEARLGINQNINNVQEGDDVNLICVVQANPASEDVTWIHDGKIVMEESTTNVLELQNVARSSSGNYSCRASNSEGTTTSGNLPLQVKYTPMCVENQKVVTVSQPALLQGEINCPVEAFPPPDSYRWAMITLTGKKKVNPSLYRSSGRVLELTSLKHVALQLHCWASNEMGEQEDPCVFNIPPPKPEAVSGCNVTTIWTTDTPQASIVVSCVYGWSGRLPHIFTLDLLHPDGKWQQFKNKEPVFTINRLREGVQYQIELTASNAHRAGQSYVFNYTLSRSNNSLAPSTPPPLPSSSLPPPLPASPQPPPLPGSPLPPPLPSSSPQPLLPASSLQPPLPSSSLPPPLPASPQPPPLPASPLPPPLPSSSPQPLLPASSLQPPLPSSSLPPPLPASPQPPPRPSSSLQPPLPSAFSPFLVLYIVISVVLVMGILVVALLVRKLCQSNQADLKPTASNGQHCHHIHANGGTSAGTSAEMPPLLNNAPYLQLSPTHFNTVDALPDKNERSFLLPASGAPHASIDSLNTSLSSQASDLGHRETIKEIPAEFVLSSAVMESLSPTVMESLSPTVMESLSPTVTESFPSAAKATETSL